jgi:Tfp pilus assembly protein PilV
MGAYRKNQSGFGMVEALVVVAVVAALGTAGWLVYRHDNKKSVSNNTPSTSQTATQSPVSSSTTPNQQTSAAILDIKEWGVHLTLDSTTASLYYYIDPNQPDIAYFSLKDIDSIAPNCAASKFSLGAIGRQTEAEHQGAAASPSALKQPGTIHIGNYWYLVQLSESDCTSSDQSAQISQQVPGYSPAELQKVLSTLAAD